MDIFPDIMYSSGIFIILTCMQNSDDVLEVATNELRRGAGRRGADSSEAERGPITMAATTMRTATMMTVVIAIVMCMVADNTHAFKGVSPNEPNAQGGSVPKFAQEFAARVRP